MEHKVYFEKIVQAGTKKQVMEYIDLLAMNERNELAENKGGSGWEDRLDEDDISLSEDIYNQDKADFFSGRKSND